MFTIARIALVVVFVSSRSIALADAVPAPHPVTGPGVTGTVVRYANMPSANVAARNVDVWLPPGYGKEPARRYPVLYMHDGQNLFDPATSYAKVDWAIDEVMTGLIEKGQVREAIVVGVWNSPRRLQEYMPQRAVASAARFEVPGVNIKPGDIISDSYLAFLVQELKPFIDATYRTLPDRANTSIMGSSLGGLISQYALSKYPDVYGGAGCVSTHWPVGEGIALEDFGKHLTDPATHRYWFDFGTETIDAEYEPYQKSADEMLRKAGYVEGKNWITRKFEGAEHSEKAWRLRVDQPLVFLLGR
jgi:predicted alpha/beta superfamily hydrolase